MLDKNKQIFTQPLLLKTKVMETPLGNPGKKPRYKVWNGSFEKTKSILKQQKAGRVP